jgi:hypothetical protein
MEIDRIRIKLIFRNSLVVVQKLICGENRMTLGGWVLMISTGFFTVAFVWCMTLVLLHKPEKEDLE